MHKKIWISIVTILLAGVLFLLIGYAIYTAYTRKQATPSAGSNPCSLPQYTLGVPVLPSNLPSDATFIQNSGMVCFQAMHPNNFRTTVQTGNIACMSSSCTIVYERVGELKVQKDPPAILLQARFAAKNVGSERPSGEVCACTADCQGAGFLEFETGALDNGVYAVRLGDLKLGDLVVPSTSEFQCFSSLATTAPYTTPIPTSTRDPNAYPPPGFTPTPTYSPYPYPK